MSGNGAFHTAAHVQGIGPQGNDSGQVTNGQIIIVLPEPGGIALGTGLLLGLFRRRSR